MVEASFTSKNSALRGRATKKPSVIGTNLEGSAADRTGRLQNLHAIISSKSVVRDKHARILAPDGMRQNWLIDLRTTFLDPTALNIAAGEFWNRFEARLPFQIVGLELGAVPLISAFQLQGLNRGFSINGVVVRRERKNYGLSRSFEGELTKDPIVVVDDTFNSASSAEKIRVVLSEENRSIRDLFSVIDYRNPRGTGWINRHNINLVSLFSLADFGLHPTKARPVPRQSEFAAVWHFSLSGGHYFDIAPSSAPAFDDKRLYLGSDDGRLWALDKATGAPAWQFCAGGSGPKRIRSSPAVHRGKVYFGSYEGKVHCLEVDSGRELWRFEGGDWIESSPALSPELGMLFIGLEHSVPRRRGSLAALYLTTGEKIWEFSIEGHVQASPVFDPRSRLVACGTSDGELLVFDPVARNLLWRYCAGGTVRSAVAFDKKRDGVLIGALDGSIHSIGLSTGTARWSARTGDAIYSTPLVVGDQVYVTSTDKNLYIFDAHNGKILGCVPTLGKIYATPRLIEGRVYFGATSGIVYEIDLASYDITGRIQLPERIADPILHDPLTRLFYARSSDGKVYAFCRRT
jgi:outer membrane protein assembly factor BamB/orotate phosphoribosyltransferase